MDHDTMTCSCCGGDLPMRAVWEATRHATTADCTGAVGDDCRCNAFGDYEWDLHHRILNGESVDLTDL